MNHSADAAATSPQDATICTTSTSLGARSQTPRVVLAWSGNAEPRRLPKAQFFERARCERLRALRTGTQVTLVVVSIDGRANPAAEDLYELSNPLQAHLRETDLIGWYAKNAVAMLLPDTDEAKAEKCVERIRCQLTDFALSFRVIAYSKAPSFFGGGSPAAVVELHYEDGLRLRLYEDASHPQALAGYLRVPRRNHTARSCHGGAAIVAKAISKGPIIFK